MKYEHHSVRCKHGFCRDLVRCPSCDDIDLRTHTNVLGNDYAPGYRRPQVINNAPVRISQTRGYTYGRDVGGGRQR